MAPCSRCFKVKPPSRLAKSLKPLTKSKVLLSALLSKVVPKSLLALISKCLAGEMRLPIDRGPQFQRDQSTIYRDLMQNPKLHATRGGINWCNFIYSSEEKLTARYYASLLWNWKLHSQARRCNKLNEHMQKSLYLTVKYMEDKDLQVIRLVLQRYHGNTFKPIDGMLTLANLKTYLLERICEDEGCINALVEVIHNWFLAMPILLELAKCSGWDYLIQQKACLLNVDTLYSILLNLMYGTNSQKPNDLSF